MRNWGANPKVGVQLHPLLQCRTAAGTVAYVPHRMMLCVRSAGGISNFGPGRLSCTCWGDPLQKAYSLSLCRFRLDRNEILQECA